MKKLEPDITDYYTAEVVNMIVEKYNFSPMDALRHFASSQTHALLEDEECGMTAFGAGAIFELWEVERVTGDPRNSVYIREE